MRLNAQAVGIFEKARVAQLGRGGRSRACLVRVRLPPRAPHTLAGSHRGRVQLPVKQPPMMVNIAGSNPAPGHHTKERARQNQAGDGWQFSSVPITVIYDDGAKTITQRCVSFYLSEDRRIQVYQIFTLDVYEKVVRVEVGERSYSTPA